MNVDVRDLHADAGLRAAWPLVPLLRPGLDEASFVEHALWRVRSGYRATLPQEDGIPRAHPG